jgi:hypothetical protein
LELLLHGPASIFYARADTHGQLFAAPNRSATSSRESATVACIDVPKRCVITPAPIGPSSRYA